MSRINVVILILVVTGCETVTNKRFSEYAGNSNNYKNIDVILDILVSFDVEGKRPGFDQSKQVEILEEQRLLLDQELQRRGYRPNFVFVGSGLTLEALIQSETGLEGVENEESIALDGSKKVQEKPDNYKDSEWYFVNMVDGKASEERVNLPYVYDGDKDFANPETGKFLNRLVVNAKEIGTILKESGERIEQKDGSKGRKKKKTVIKRYRRIAREYSEDAIPDSISRLNSDALLYFRIHAGEVGMGKTVGIALAQGLFTAAATGGAYAAYSAPATGSGVDMVVFDNKSNKVVWHEFLIGGGPKKIKNSLRNLLYNFPSAEGKIIRTGFGKPVTKDSEK